MLRFLLFLFPFASLLFSPLIFLLSFIAILYGCLTTLRQIDLKKNNCLFFSNSYELFNVWIIFF
jgi:NADH:ubiquinone oxidoreductase subunit 4 (subunit M)